MNPVKALQEHGQAVWLDFLARGFTANGSLKKLVDEDGLRGVTSNPSIFEKAIDSSDEYDDELKRTLTKSPRIWRWTPTARSARRSICGAPSIART
jgi:transaldolase / glucose-6-phosphate isomerase